jgi:hypothetical protein
MKTKTPKKKLSLHRETLRALHESTLRDAVGGAPLGTQRTCGIACTDACSGGPGCTLA